MDNEKPKGMQNEGEGSTSADKEYREGATGFAKKNDPAELEKKGLDADREVAMYRDEFEKAEKAGRSHSAGDDPKDLGSSNWQKKP